METDEYSLVFTRPPPDLINKKEEYKVKSIISHKKQYGKRLYLVKWKGYPLSESSWQTVEDFTNVEEVLFSYLYKYNI